MNIWIRTQDSKRLVEVKVIDLIKKNITGKRKEEDFGITLGKYDSLERAEDIFNDISQFIEKSEEKLFKMPIK